MKIVNWLTIALTVTTISNYAEAAVSLSEIKRAAQTITPTCAYVSVESVKKINGIQRSSQLYEVEFTYTARLTTPPENNKINTQMALLKKEQAETEATVNKVAKTALENYPEISMDNCKPGPFVEPEPEEAEYARYPEYLMYYREWEGRRSRWDVNECRRLVQERESKRAQMSSSVVNTPEYRHLLELDKKFANFAQMKVNNFLKVCPATYGDGYKRNNLNEQFNFKEKPAVELIDHHLYGAKMIKTDNGWMLSN